MMVTTFNGDYSKTINSCHSSTNANDEKELDTFSKKLPSLVRSIPKHNVLIIGSDMNAQKGKNVTTNSAYTTRQTEMENS